MDIEFKNLLNKLDVIEYVIRKTHGQYDEAVTGREMDHLQARLLIKDFDDDCLHFSISYYSADNEFLGLDDADNVYVTASKDKSIPLSTPLDIPDNTARAVVRFIFDDEVKANHRFYAVLLKVASGLVVAWLAVMLWRSITNL